MSERIEISLPSDLVAHARGRVGKDGFESLDAYFQALVANDQGALISAELEAKLLEGLDAPAHPWSREELEQIRRRVHERASSRQTA
jgi:Arc/MetJ-type ribon-helix-helix transcriptional regulator